MGTSERRQREKRQRREAILETARTLFLARGVLATTMNEIAEALEFSKGSLYLHFRSKEELVFAILQMPLASIRVEVERVAGGPGAAAERLADMKRAYLEYYTRYFDHFRFIQYLDYGLKTGEDAPQQARGCFQEIERIQEVLIRVLSEGTKDGSVRGDLDPRKAAVMLVHVLESFMQKIAARGQAIERETGYGPTELVAQMFDLLQDSLMPGRGGV